MRHVKTLSRDERQKSFQAKSPTVPFQDTHTCNILKAHIIFFIKRTVFKTNKPLQSIFDEYFNDWKLYGPFGKRKFQGKLIKLKKKKKLNFYFASLLENLSSDLIISNQSKSNNIYFSCSKLTTITWIKKKSKFRKCMKHGAIDIKLTLAKLSMSLKLFKKSEVFGLKDLSPSPAAPVRCLNAYLRCFLDFPPLSNNVKEAYIYGIYTLKYFISS